MVSWARVAWGSELDVRSRTSGGKESAGFASREKPDNDSLASALSTVSSSRAISRFCNGAAAPGAQGQGFANFPHLDQRSRLWPEAVFVVTSMRSPPWCLTREVSGYGRGKLRGWLGAVRDDLYGNVSDCDIPITIERGMGVVFGQLAALGVGLPSWSRTGRIRGCLTALGFLVEVARPGDVFNVGGLPATRCARSACLSLGPTSKPLAWRTRGHIHLTFECRLHELRGQPGLQSVPTPVRGPARPTDQQLLLLLL